MKAWQPAAFQRRCGCGAALPKKGFESFVGFVIKKEKYGFHYSKSKRYKIGVR